MELGQRQYFKNDPLLENAMRPNCMVCGTHLNLLIWPCSNLDT